MKEMSLKCLNENVNKTERYQLENILEESKCILKGVNNHLERIEYRQRQIERKAEQIHDSIYLAEWKKIKEGVG